MIPLPARSCLRRISPPALYNSRHSPTSLHEPTSDNPARFSLRRQSSAHPPRNDTPNSPAAGGKAQEHPCLRASAGSGPSAHVPLTPKLRDMASYSFPASKLSRTLSDDSKTPILLISCGSFSPITYLHLRMFEMCRDWARKNTEYEIIGGYLSPVSDAYQKSGLTTADHRVQMCRLATQESNWIMVDDWEAVKREYTRTALVLDHFDEEINGRLGGIKTSTGETKRVRIALLSGADLLDTMSHPGVWAHEDLDHILGRYGAFIIERSGTDVDAALSKLEKWRKHIHTIPQLIQNDVSSTKIRAFLGKDMSIR